MDFGKKTISESYVRGQLKRTKTTYSVPTVVHDRTAVFNEMLNSLELITNKKTKQLILRIDTDPDTFQIRMLTKEWTESK